MSVSEKRGAGEDVEPLGKRERTKAANRQAILDAARAVFSELGYGATTVRDIIRRTGLASGTFYNYFKSKEEVFEALLDQNALNVRPRLKAERIRSHTFEEFVEGMFRVFFDYLASERSDYAMLRRNTGALRVRMDTPEVIAGFEELQQDIERGIARGMVPPVDAEYLTAAFVGIAFEVGERMLQKEDTPENAATFATALLLGGVKGLTRLSGSDGT